jgi:uncharacterized Tic20 family protein
MENQRIPADPGYRRRDVEPHRGSPLVLLGMLSLIVVVLGPLVIYLAKSDLRKIDAGDMDPEGRQLTKLARKLGFASILILSATISAAAAVIGIWVLTRVITGQV